MIGLVQVFSSQQRATFAQLSHECQPLLNAFMHEGRVRLEAGRVEEGLAG